MTSSPATGAPLVGISCYAQRARWATWDDEAVLLPRRYADKVAEAGGIPVLLPPVAGVEHALPRLDALVLSGGGDIDPACYATPRDPATGPASAARDGAEVALCRGALELGLPLLGICRGLQVINVSLGGTLHQHLPDIVGHDGHSPQESGYGQHDVTVAADSRLAGVLGRAELAVPTHHHQAIARLGDGLGRRRHHRGGGVRGDRIRHGRPRRGGHARGAMAPRGGRRPESFRLACRRCARKTSAAGWVLVRPHLDRCPTYDLHLLRIVIARSLLYYHRDGINAVPGPHRTQR